MPATMHSSPSKSSKTASRTLGGPPASVVARPLAFSRGLCTPHQHCCVRLSATPGQQQLQLEAPVQPRSLAANPAAQEGQQEGAWEEEEYDVLGLGQLMVDFAAAVDDDMLAALDVPKGGRRIVSAEEKASVMERLQGFDSQVSAGGSLANSLVGIAQLAAARERFLEGRQQHTSSNSSASSSPSSSPSPAGRQRRIRVAMAGCCGGSDALGEYGRAQLAAAGVELVSVDGEEDGGSAPARFSGSTTGTVMVFTTPDAQRSFLSSFSSEDSIHLTPALLQAVTKARLLVVEGYLWELPGAAEVIPAVVKHARAVGTLVVLTAGDASVVQRHGGKVLETIRAGVDMFVSNVGEAQELQAFLHQQQQQQQDPQQQLAQAAEQLQLQQQEMAQHAVLLDPQGSASMDSMWDAASSSGSSRGAAGSSSEGQQVACELAGVCPMVVVTDGSRGSYITALGQLLVVPPYWRSHAPVDTTGAGDAYASGMLFAFLLGLDLHSMGHVAAKTASAVISRHGPQLLSQDADGVAGVALGRCGALAMQVMAGSSSSGSSSSSSNSSSTSLAAMQLQGLGFGVDVSVDASQLLPTASM